MIFLKYILNLLLIALELYKTIQKDVRHEMCRVTKSGNEYIGKVSETKSGHICEYWESDTLGVDNKAILDIDFPDGNRRIARNFCRNPDNSSDGPWCYRRSENGIKENCTIPLCCNDENCKYTGPGMEYIGGIQKSVYDNECLYWAAVEKTKDIEKMFPEGSLMLAGKSCRNPTGVLSGPWCYVLNEEELAEQQFEKESWIQEPCDIQTCFNLQFITVITNEVGNDIQNYYTHFSSINSENEEITFSIRLWNPEDWRNGEINIALSLLAVPIKGDQLRSWDVGYEIIVRNIRTGATANSDEDENWENNAGLVSGIQWAHLKLAWKNGFIALSAQNKEKPYFIHEIKSQGNGIISQHSLPIKYISIMGTYTFWNFSQIDEQCEEQITTSLKVTRYWLLLTESVNKFLGLHIRSAGTGVIYFKISPVNEYPRVQLRMKAESGKASIYLDKNNNETNLLTSAMIPSSLSYWKWTEFAISISGHRYHMLVTTKKGLETVFDINNAVFQAIKWYAIASSTTSHWTLFCKPTKMEYEAMPPECSVSDKDMEYDGHQWITQSGLPCLPWNANILSNLDNNQFPEGSITAALNYCRNPTGDDQGTYCIAVSISNEIKTNKEPCGLRKCKFKDCRIAGTATDFMGQVSTTISGKECQEWGSNTPHKIPMEFLLDERFPERSVKGASNYCRNPSYSIGGPWCYTKEPDVQYDLCNVPDCYMPTACTVIVTMATRRKVFIVPQWRAHGLPFSIKMWNPNVSTALIFNVYPLAGDHRYQLILGDDDNENIKLYYIPKTGDEKLLKQKTYGHFLSSGRWISIIINVRDTEINISYEDSPNPFFIWKKGASESIPPVNAMYFSYEAKSNEFDEGSLGLKFPCDVCQAEICMNELSPYSVYYPVNIWRENSTIVVNNITFHVRGSGVFTVNLFVVPAKYPIGILNIDDGSFGDLMELQFTLKKYMHRVAVKHKGSPGIVKDYWSEVILTFEEKNGTLILNGSTFMIWQYPRLPLLYYFSVQCSDQMTWVVNCQPPKLDGTPINGHWSTWSPWECSVTCGGGTGIRRRICNNPEPSMFGKTCEGSAIGRGTCNENKCGEVTIDTINLIRKYLAQNANNIQINIHESVKLQCNTNLSDIIKKESPKSLVQWNKNGIKIMDDLKMETTDIDNFKIEISTANISDSGVYACVLVKTDEEHEIFDITVLIVKTNDYTVKKRIGQKLILRANTLVLSNVYSNLRLTWYCNNKTYKEYDITDLSLINEEIIYPIKKEYNGEWISVVFQDQLALNWTTSWYKVQIKSKANWATYILEEDLFKGKLGRHEIIIYIAVVLIFIIVIGATVAFTIFIIRLQKYFKNLTENK